MSESQHDNPNPFIVLVGAPGSGKSTWARRYFSGPEIVSSDRMRAMVGDHSADLRATEQAMIALRAVVRGRTELGKTVVVDATHRASWTRRKSVEPAIAWCRPAVAVVFLTPVEVCLERNARRKKPRRVPEGWVRETCQMIEEAFDPATTWFPPDFHGGVLFVRHEQHGYVGGSLTLRRWAQADWLDCAREAAPEWFRGPGKWNRLHRCGWDAPGRSSRTTSEA